MERKNLAILSLLVLINASFIGNLIIAFNTYSNLRRETNNILTIACAERYHPAVLDPVDSWDVISNNMIRHVCDTLWRYDLLDPTFPLEMLLATSYSWNSGMDELTVSLREDVWFHDGSKFNATAVKFTFDRILYFINWSGEVPGTTHVCDPASLFYDMYRNPIFNQIEIIDEYTVKFVLSEPNGVFLSLLTYEACSILHPNSVDATSYLSLGIDILIGTGPFKYIHFIAGEELRLDRWDLYWGDNVFWDRMLWEYYPDTLTANEAILDGKADFLYNPSNSFIPTFQAEEDIHVAELDSSSIFRYWGLNNRKINNSFVRKAMAYAYNYTYYTDIVRLGFMVRAQQFLPPGFPYHNVSFRGPYYNTSIARQVMMDAFPNETATAGCTSEPFGDNPTNDAAWSALDLLTYIVEEHEGWSIGIMMNVAFANDMDAIGIEVVSDVWDWWDPIWYPSYNEDRLETWHTGWSPYYLDPFNILEPLLSNMSGANYLQNHDNLIHKWLDEYEETNPANTTKRAQLLYKIQQRAINELYVLIPVAFDKTYYVHHRSLGGVSYNIMNNLWLADSYYIPGIPII